MKLLVDNQLPLALARFLDANGVACRHVQDIGMEAMDDRAIWDYAKDNNLTIVTKDEDFPILADRQATIPPQVVWVRLGNCRKAALLQVFAKLLPNLRSMLEAGSNVIEIR